MYVEILNPKKFDIIIGFIYKHPSMDLNYFNTNYLNSLLDKLSKEQKSVFLLGDCNINRLNYNNHNPANEFLDSLASNSFVLYILQPTRLTSHSKTVIDNIFSNAISPEAISGNLNKTNIFEKDWSNFDQENFFLDYFPIDWNVVMKLLNKINSLLSNYAALKKSTSAN